jgi:UDP-N-acetylmuramoyl-L-alanyl-D-glutamate--2,6-diaminopimelate ligase
MVLLNDLFAGVPIVDHIGSLSREIDSIQFDSRKVSPGCVFVAVPGTQVDGHRFIPTALSLGATAIVCERLPEERREDIAYIKVASASSTLGLLAHAYHGRPSQRLRLVGVTGTNGKTTTATLLYRLHRALGHTCGLLSTIRNYVGDELIPSTHTTGDALQIADLMSRMVRANCTHCFMEVTSHAIDQNRISGLEFDGAIFTNLTHDHLDYHGTIEAYRDVKKSFFDGLSEDAFALANTDDPVGQYMLRDTMARRATYGTGATNDFHLEVLSADFAGLRLAINGRRLSPSLLGRFNAYNITTAIGAAVLLNEDRDHVFVEAEKLEPVEGRMERLVGSDCITVVVDFAHTPDALEKVLSNLSGMNPNGRPITTVVGCGGDRDREKRPLMASIAARLSGRVILTSDNPRTEDPDKIIEQMLCGIEETSRGHVSIIPDRKMAIDAICAQAEPESLILIAGKGHEKYQEINGVRYPFDDVAIAKAALAMRTK